MSAGDACPITVPKGDPGALADAATTWRSIGEAIGNAANAITRSGTVATRWEGAAAMRYDAYTQKLLDSYFTTEHACQLASTAAHRLSDELRHAQTACRHAIQRWQDAEQQRAAAAVDAGAAGRELQGQQQAARQAREKAAHLRQGSHGVNEAAAAEQDTKAAHADSKAGDAKSAMNKANRRLDDAVTEQRAQVKHAHRVFEDLRADERRAAHAFDHAEGAIAIPPRLGTAPVPVAVTGDGVSGISPVAPHGLTPGDIRREQVEQEQQALKKLKKAIDKKKLGSILDGESAIINGLTLGIIDLGGDKNSKRYKFGHLEGEIGSYVIPVAGIGGDVVRVTVRVAVAGGKITVKTTEKTLAGLLRRPIKKAEAKAVEELGDGATAKERQAAADKARERVLKETKDALKADLAVRAVKRLISTAEIVIFKHPVGASDAAGQLIDELMRLKGQVGIPPQIQLRIDRTVAKLREAIDRMRTPR